MAVSLHATSLDPGKVESVLNEVRSKIAVEDRVLRQARRRRDRIRRLAEQFLGALRSFNSGSLAHGTANNPLKDADGGVVLDRRVHYDYGPDGLGVGPTAIVEAMARFIWERLREDFPNVTYEITKRAIVFEFHAPIDDEDPSVDLIVALNRQGAPGLLIPNTEHDRWDPSDPEKHTELLVGGPAELRVFRARVIRLAKAAVHNDGDRAVVISFNIEALALELITDVTSLADGLLTFFTGAAASLASGLTDDPAGVSGPIKLPEGITPADAVGRLAYFGSRVEAALDAAYDAQQVRAILAEIYGPQLPGAEPMGRHRLARALEDGADDALRASAFGPAAAYAKQTRSFGRHARA